MKGCIKLFLCTIFCLLFATGIGLASDPPLALSDDFSSGLTDNWIPGRAANEGGTHALSIEDGELVWVQQYDYIESKALFGRQFRSSVPVFLEPWMTVNRSSMVDRHRWLPPAVENLIR